MSPLPGRHSPRANGMRATTRRWRLPEGTAAEIHTYWALPSSAARLATQWSGAALAGLAVATTRGGASRPLSGGLSAAAPLRDGARRHREAARSSKLGAQRSRLPRRWGREAFEHSSFGGSGAEPVGRIPRGRSSAVSTATMTTRRDTKGSSGAQAQAACALGPRRQRGATCWTVADFARQR